MSLEKRCVLMVIGLCCFLMACGGVSSDSAVTVAVTATVQTATTPETTPTTHAQSASPTATTQFVDDKATTQPLHQVSLVEFPNAGSIDFTFSGEGHVYVVYGQESDLYVTQSDDGGATFSEPVVATDVSNVFVYPLERPAIAVGADGQIHVAWPEDNFPNRIWYAVSADDGQTFSPSIPLSQPGQETVLVRLLLGSNDSPFAFWLQNSGLSFAKSEEDAAGFLPDRVIDEQTCDCCHPQPQWLNGELVIAYRNLVIDEDGRHIRDIYLVKSVDGGETFAEPVRISDAPWYIASCPFSGPSMVADGDGTLYVSWMDGRNDSAGDFSQTDIWLASSADGGQTFSANRRINQTTDVYNNLPSIAVDATVRLHFLWQAREAKRDVLYYTTSSDGGETIAPAQVLVDSRDNAGRRPTNATLYVSSEGVVYASWVDRAGGYFASWQTGE